MDGEKAILIRLDRCSSSVERGERDVEVSILNDNDVMYIIKFCLYYQVIYELKLTQNEF